jgi:hypothetical protein
MASGGELIKEAEICFENSKPASATLALIDRMTSVSPGSTLAVVGKETISAEMRTNKTASGGQPIQFRSFTVGSFVIIEKGTKEIVKRVPPGMVPAVVALSEISPIVSVVPVLRTSNGFEATLHRDCPNIELIKTGKSKTVIMIYFLIASYL